MKFPKIELDPKSWELLFQGAESKVFRGKYESKYSIWKERFVKEYRHPELDKKLTRERIRAELKAYEKIVKNCPELGQIMPEVLYCDDRNIIFTELKDSCNVSEYIQQNSDNEDSVKEALIQMAKIVCQIHKSGIIHGDLTTSNFLVNKTTLKIVPIDFGLSFGSQTDEDRAVDLYVLERAIESTHPDVCFTPFVNEYEKQVGDDKVIKRLEVVRQRGRKRICIG